MDKLYSNYKISQQRVWPFPNQIKTGTNDFIVSSRLTKKCVTGLGKTLLDKSIVADFNMVAFSDEVLKASKRSIYKIQIQSADDFSTPNVDEGYHVKIDENGIEISATSYIGAVYALETLKQLIRKKGNQYVIENTPMEISDSPKIQFRGVMLDCARHFLPLKLLKQQVKAMAFQKLNHLHLHLTDGQSFPLALGPNTKRIAWGKSFKERGAFSESEVYTKKEIRELVEYAKQRGVRIIPETDTPGHAYSWTYGYPDIMTCNDVDHQSEETCPEPPCGFFNLQDKLPEIKTIVEGVFNEVIDAFNVGKKGYGSYYHIGFDEVGCPNFKSSVCQSPSCEKAFGQNSVKYANWLLGWFKKAHPSIKTVMWIDQILMSNFNANNQYTNNVEADPEHVILHFWNLDSATPFQINQLAATGFSLINSQSTVYYLDAGGEGNQSYRGGPVMSLASSNATKLNIGYEKYWMATYPGMGPSSPISSGWAVSWEEIYLNNITWLTTDIGSANTGNFVNIPLKQKGKGGIIGACAALWGEQVDFTNLEQKLWPKATALAEALWKFDENKLPDNILNARYRIAFAREDLLRLGVQASPVLTGDLFKNAPWGALHSDTSLMYDINQNKQQIPVGFVLQYKRFWDKGIVCVNPVNPFCGNQISQTMHCDGTGEPYVQQGCEYPIQGT